MFLCMKISRPEAIMLSTSVRITVAKPTREGPPFHHLSPLVIPRRIALVLSTLLFVPLAVASIVSAETTLFAPVPLTTAPDAAGPWIVSTTSARRSLDLGFAASAAAQAEKLLARTDLPDAEREEVVLLLATARLEQGRPAAAETALTGLTDVRSPRIGLLRGLIAARQSDFVAARNAITGLQPEDFAPRERTWYHYLEAQLAEAVKDTAAATAAYEAAVRLAATESQTARLRVAREMLRLRLGETNPQTAEALREQAERYVGRGVGLDFAAQYAVALHQLGRGADAITYLQEQIALLPDSLARGRDDLRLLLILIAGPAQPAGRSAAEQLLLTAADQAKRPVALQLLAAAADTAETRSRLRRTLDELLMRAPDSPLAPLALITRGEAALMDRDFSAAEADARAFLQRHPTSVLRARALAQLAAVAWELRRFRTAADFAAQAATAATDPELASALRLLSAEASFRASDYQTAAQTYAQAADAPPLGVSVDTVRFQQVLSLIEAGRLEQAAEILDQEASEIGIETRWQAEWNLARALQASRQIETARNRLAALFAANGPRPPALRARLEWLSTRLALQAGRAQEALTRARALPERLADVPDDLAMEIAGLARLAEAEALFSLGDNPAALAALTRARQGAGEAALQSYLLEADFQAAGGDLVKAQELLTTFADDHATHPYAPVALYQAALHAARRGEERVYRDAYLLLERLLALHPEHELAFHARLQQGDLLRLLNQFPQAQQIYELLINRYAQHPDILAARMALADCHRAQAAFDPSHFESAIAVLERLRDLPDAPAARRAEAGFKLGDMLSTRDPVSGVATWDATADQLITQGTSLDSDARYWLGRILLRLAGTHEQNGDELEARRRWRLIVDLGLPGRAIAADRLGSITAEMESVP